MRAQLALVRSPIKPPHPHLYTYVQVCSAQGARPTDAGNCLSLGVLPASKAHPGVDGRGGGYGHHARLLGQGQGLGVQLLHW